MTDKEFIQGFACFIGFILIVIIGAEITYLIKNNKMYIEEQNTSTTIEYCNIEDTVYCINDELMYKKEIYNSSDGYIIFSSVSDVKKLTCSCKN